MHTCRRRLSSGSSRSSVQVFAVHPGMVLTDVVRSLPWFVRKAYNLIMGLLLITARQGEGPLLHLCLLQPCGQRYL